MILKQLSKDSQTRERYNTSVIKKHNIQEVITMSEFLKKAFSDMKESAKAQHDVDKANFAAVKAESKAQIEEAKAMRNPEKRKAMMQAERDTLIEEANKRKAEAEERIKAAQGN